ncbi:hypothetical protein D3C78_1007470 [compost metagenome]
MEPLHRFEVLTVDVCLAEFQPFDRFHRHVQILRINRRRQTIFAVVSHGQRLFERIKYHHRQHRTEGFFVHNGHILTHIQQ